MRKQHPIQILLAKSYKILACASLITIEGGCGIVTPKIQEFWANDNAHQIAVNSIVGQIGCEIGQAVRSVYYSKRDFTGSLNFLKDWGAQFSLILSVCPATS